MLLALEVVLFKRVCINKSSIFLEKLDSLKAKETLKDRAWVILRKFSSMTLSKLAMNDS